MKLIHHTAEQSMRKIKTAEQMIAKGKPIADVCRAIKVAQPAYQRWQQKYGCMQTEEDKQLTRLG